ncbi:hypothetical protein P7K49_036999 [Saguinus oedipus]|uniref:Uncharacterized protein n=1 Tax=Saguinus oedipus TaxID=9490 RepID=A0ABQ9TLR5_SAGOE|nr:hypothetical protein P7K49_036999 [Saguinus oedipus]
MGKPAGQVVEGPLRILLGTQSRAGASVPKTELPVDIGVCVGVHNPLGPGARAEWTVTPEGVDYPQGFQMLVAEPLLPAWCVTPSMVEDTSAAHSCDHVLDNIWMPVPSPVPSLLSWPLGGPRALPYVGNPGIAALPHAPWPRFLFYQDLLASISSPPWSP